MKSFVETVNSYADICAILGVDPSQTPDVSAYDEEDKAAAVAFFRLTRASKAAWKYEKMKIDWNDWNQRKWFNYFDLRSVGSGVGFSFYVCDCVFSFSCVGARLSFPSEEISEHIAGVMEEDYKAFMTIPE